MTGLVREIAARRRLLRGGVKLSSLLLMPIRRRFGRSQFDLKNGLKIVAADHISLVNMFNEIYVDGCYRHEGLIPPPGAAIIDIGANIGVFTLCAASLYPDTRIIAVEPSPRMCQALRSNIARNNLRQVTVVQAACGRRTEERMLYSGAREALNSFYPDRRRSRPLLRTPAVSLDELFERHRVDRCAFLKLDCEGAEYEILLAAERVLPRIAAISLEYHVGLNEHTPEELAAFLQGRGYDVARIVIDHESGYLHARPAAAACP